jgi:two-component system, sensor histidine kinase and response regulator
MPDLDGYEATPAIRRDDGDGRHVPLVAMSAGTRRGDREICLAGWMDDYLAKPLTLYELQRTLTRWTPTPNGSDPAGPLKATAPAPVPAGDGPLDAAGVTRLRSDFGSIGRLVRLVELFVDRAPEELADIRMAIGAGNAATVRDGAHKLKGGCLTLAATAMAELCDELETMVGGDSLEGATSLVDQIESVFDETHAALLLVVG